MLLTLTDFNFLNIYSLKNPRKELKMEKEPPFEECWKDFRTRTYARYPALTKLLQENSTQLKLPLDGTTFLGIGSGKSKPSYTHQTIIAEL